MKKTALFSFFLVIVLLCGLLSACGSTESAAPSPTAEPAEAQTAAPTPEPTPEPDPTMSEDELLAYMQDHAMQLVGEDKDGELYTSTACCLDAEGTALISLYGPIGMTALRVQMANEKEYDVASIAGYDVVSGLAVVKLSEETLVPDESDGEGLTVATVAAETLPFAPAEHALAVGDTVYFYDVDQKTLAPRTVAATEMSFGALKCIELEMTEAAEDDSYASIIVVNGYGELIGLDPFVADVPDETGEDYVSCELCPLASMADSIALDKALTLEEYNDWYNTETSLCWTPMDYNDDCYYCLTRTYQEITGVKCKSSGDVNGKSSKGYLLGGYYYEYDMSVEEFDQYAEYLKSMGYAMAGEDTYTDGTSYYFWNENEAICIDLFVSSDGKTLFIFPKYGYIA